MSGLLGQMIGEYRLVEFLGAGGMGEVYRGQHSKIGRIVAIKILTRADPRADLTARFLNEARIQAGLQHRHIVGLYDFIEHAGRPCIIMEYIAGEMLDRRLERSRGLQLAEALPLFKEIVEAVAHLHKNRIVHRDIKSSNIKIDPAGAVKLLDFGIARDPQSDKVTKVGSYVGTLQYSAPELLSGANADFRSDVWALGILFYEMLCGRVPFEASSITGFLKIIARPSYDRPSRVNASCTAAAERIIDRCLEKEPGKRYASAKELLEAIGQVDGRESRAAFSAQKSRDGWNLIARTSGPMVGVGSLAVALVVWLLWSSEPAPVQPTVTNNLGNTKPVGPQSPQQSSVQSGVVQQGGSLRHVSIKPFVVDNAQILDSKSGEVIGHTPFHKELPLGKLYTWTLRAAGYEDTPLQFTVRETENVYSPILKERQK